MPPTNVFCIFCLFAMLHVSNGFKPYMQHQRQPFYGYHGYSSSEEANKFDSSDSGDSGDNGEQDDKVGTWIKANQNEIVRCHNDIRSKVNPSASDMMKVQWDAEVARNAEAAAKMCSYKHSDPSKRVIKEPFKTTCGENIYFSSGPDPWEEVVNDWKSEVEVFDYGYGPRRSSDRVGHYTQVVWATSKMIGCYHQYCEGLAFPHIFVCQYCPAGNNKDTMKTPYSKGKPCSKCKGKCENQLCVE